VEFQDDEVYGFFLCLIFFWPARQFPWEIAYIRPLSTTDSRANTERKVGQWSQDPTWAPAFRPVFAPCLGIDIGRMYTKTSSHTKSGRSTSVFGSAGVTKNENERTFFCENGVFVIQKRVRPSKNVQYSTLRANIGHFLRGERSLLDEPGTRFLSIGSRAIEKWHRDTRLLNLIVSGVKFTFTIEFHYRSLKFRCDVSCHDTFLLARGPVFGRNLVPGC
jgi:hypothetical protein